MKVLLSAFACCPDHGSEPAVGWLVVCAAASRHETWVLTCVHNRFQIEAQIARKPMPYAHFVYVALPPAGERLRGGTWGHWLYYALWNVLSFFEARRLHRREGFDLVHHVTYVSSWQPIWLGWLNVPFIWDGGVRECTPWRFLRTMAAREMVFEVLRGAGLRLLGAFTRIVTAARARLILTASPAHAWDPRLPVKQFLLGSIDRELLATVPPERVRDGRKFRIASVGRLMGLKGFSLGLRAFAALQREVPDCEYAIAGDGPERKHLEKLARQLGCADRVRFLGWMDRRQVLQILRESDVLVHPSFHEGFGYVLVEAMALARPVLCLSSGAPAVVVGGQGGILIEPSDPAAVVEQYNRQLKYLATHADERLAMGRRARAWVEERWTSERVASDLLQIYSAVGGTQKRNREPLATS